MLPGKILNVTVVLSAVDKMTQVVQAAAARSRAALKNAQKSMEAMDRVATGAMVAGGVILGGAALSIRAAEESAVATNRLNQVFKSMGESTNAAAAAAANYAGELSVQIGQEDEAIMAAQAKIATFAAVSNASARMAGIFDRATRAAFDLSAAGFGDAAQTSVQLGKALQDPIKGITALARSGVTFTAVEKQKIAALTKSGQILEAQKMILKAVETQVGGVAAATATDSARMRIALGELAESAGRALLPVMAEIANAIIPILHGWQTFAENNPGFVKAIAAAGVAMLAFGGTVKIVTGAVRIMTAVMAVNPFILIAAAVVAVSILIYSNWGAIKAFFGRIFSAIQARIASFAAYWINIFRRIAAVWNAVKTAFQNFGLWVQDSLNGILDYVQSIPAKMYEAGVNMINSLWEGIKAMAWKPVEAIANLASSIRDYFPFSPAKVGPLRDIHRIKLVETIAQGIRPGPALSAVRSVANVFANGGLSGGISGGVISASGGGGHTAISFSPTINVNGASGDVGGDIRTQIENVIPNLLKQIKKGMELQERKKY